MGNSVGYGAYEYHSLGLLSLCRRNVNLGYINETHVNTPSNNNNNNNNNNSNNNNNNNNITIIIIIIVVI